MVEREFVIENEIGLHAGAAAKFTQVANNYKSEIRLIKNSKIGNAKSLLSVLVLGIFKGSRFKVQIVGSDELEAANGITRLIDNNFEFDDEGSF